MCFCCDNTMKKLLPRDHAFERFQMVPAAQLKSLALAQPALQAGARYPLWVTDSEYAAFRPGCQYVVDTNWSQALLTARTIIEQHSHIKLGLRGNWSQADVEAAVGKHSLSPKSETAAVSLISEPIEVFKHPEGLTFLNGNHRATVLGSLVPDELVPVLMG